MVIGENLGDYAPNPHFDPQPGSNFYAATAWPQPKAILPTITYHETILGHFLQLDVSDQYDLPPFRRRTEFDGYLDGWALYAERLMWEMGAYKDDPYGNLGRLLLELQRAVRVVADTGIHSKHWTYDEAIAYMEQAVGSGGEAKRYIGYPAQAVSYFIGFLKILELRQKAMDALGTRFNLKKFHHVLLCNGEMPLAILEQLVDDYINRSTMAQLIL